MKTFRLTILIAGLALTASTVALTLTPDAPARYEVRSGDTLWSLAGRYLADPWSWPELWRAGAGIDNPNRIYPGDILILGRDADGRPQLTREMAEPGPEGGTVRLSPSIRTTALQPSLPLLPPALTADFMGHPTLLTANHLDELPYVLGFEHERLAGALGNLLYVRGLARDAAGPFGLFHVGDEVRDPSTGRLMGYQAVYTGSASVEKRGRNRREASSLKITDSVRETLPGDRLVAGEDAPSREINPHPLKSPLEARIAAVVDGVRVIGQYDVVILNRGARSGLESGHVLSLWHEAGHLPDRGPGDPTKDERASAVFRGSVRLPPEHAGTVLIFRTYPEASYGLVLSARSELSVGDVARTP
jgi:hypothetical protein